MIIELKRNTLFTLVILLFTNTLCIAQPSKQEDKFIAYAANGELEKIEAYIKKGINVNAKNKSKWTALAYACKYNHIEIVKLLINSGADVDIAVNTGSTPLHIALNEGNIEIAEFLIENKADINIKDIMGMSALAWAAKQGKLEIVIFLIKQGADINSQNVNSRTVLDVATNENVKIYLKTKGAKTSEQLIK